MKKLTIIIFLLAFYSCEQESMSEPEIIEEVACDGGTFIGDAILTTQQEVDDFGALCYTKIDGNLSIVDLITNPDPITYLSSFSSLL